MPDTRSLRWIGIVYVAITAMVTLVTVATVQAHLSGRLTLEGTPTDISSLAR